MWSIKIQHFPHNKDLRLPFEDQTVNILMEINDINCENHRTRCMNKM